MRADALTDDAFEAMPLVAHGESKIVRDAGEGLVAIRFRPTVYSFTHDRSGEVPGTDALRPRATRVLVRELCARGVDHAYLDVGERLVIARRVVAPPVEVIVKRRHVGTPRHRYRGVEQHPIRAGQPAAGRVLAPDARYPEPWVRFDWRNPMHDPESGARAGRGAPGADRRLLDRRDRGARDLAEERAEVAEERLGRARIAREEALLERRALEHDEPEARREDDQRSPPPFASRLAQADDRRWPGTGCVPCSRTFASGSGCSLYPSS